MPAAMEKVKGEADILQARIDADNAELATGVPNSPAANELNARIARNQDDLNSLNSRFAKLQDEYDAALNAARIALYALADDAEPTFGPFLRATQGGDTFTREVDLTYPFGKPNYDRLVYTAFGEWASAENAFQQNEADVLLNTRGYIVFPPRDVPPSYPTSSARFLAFNPKRDRLTDPALRKAIACVEDMTGWFRDVKSLDEFVFAGPWRKKESLSICPGLSKEERIQHAVEILQAAGYSWVQKPTGEQAGNGLILPNGKPFPPVVLLAPMPEYDWVESNAAIFLTDQMQYLGFPVAKQYVDPETLRYAVYSSSDYDMALLGWRLSEYPGYLCDWFQAPGPFTYHSDRLKSACEALNATADLETARQSAFEIQSILMEDLPFIPLYQVLRYEAYRTVAYPFGDVLNGLSGLYGAPALAIPSR